MDKSGKDAIITQLRRYFDEMRSLPSPGYCGGIWGQRTLDFYLGSKLDASKPDDKHKPLPCVTEKEWVDIMVTMGTAAHPFEERPEVLTYFEHAFHTIFQGHSPVFTHTDLHSSNVLICNDGTVALIDWEHAGWYPSFWEYCCIILNEGYEDDRSSWIPRFLDEYLAEVGWMYKFREWVLWGAL